MEDFNLIVERFIQEHNSAHADNIEFFEKRAAGAQKIQKQAAAKGGPSKLTAIHFKAKEVPYKQCLKHIDDKSFAEKKAKACLDKLANWRSMSPEQFQRVMGELEVYGEVFLKLK